FHRKDVLDMELSTEDAHLITGSVGNSCIIWGVCKAKTHLFHDDIAIFLSKISSHKCSSTSDSANTAYISSRKDLSRPALQLPASGKPVIAVRFCPIVFNLRARNSGEFFKLPYRYVFVVATLNSLYIYDTESVPPITIFAGLHYAAITDISCSPDAKYLALSSQDGYCTLVVFDGDDLGSPFTISEGKDENKNAVHQVPHEVITPNTVVEAESRANRNQKETKQVKGNKHRQSLLALQFQINLLRGA
ncbi:hypothetical protein MKW94_028540, partial [Papaver nudicaule]|nr:hypothetical protein [Papaver nudicaule]